MSKFLIEVLYPAFVTPSTIINFFLLISIDNKSMLANEVTYIEFQALVKIWGMEVYT